MKIYKITEASDYLGVSINTLKTLANNGKIKSFKTTGEHRRFRQEDLDAYMSVERERINEKRNGIHKLIKMCFEGKVERVLIEYKDRLARFGYEYLDAIFWLS